MKYLVFIMPFILLTAFVNAADRRSDSLDILNYSINLSIRNLQNKSISGYTEIKAVSKVNGLAGIHLDLLKLPVSGVSLNGSLQNYVSNDSVLMISFSSVKNAGDTLLLRIDYAGKPKTDSTWGGFYFSGNYAYVMGVAFTSVPHNYGRCWHPCFDNFEERASYDFHITTDSTFYAVCNGLPDSSTHHTDGSITWHWHLNQPIPSYLACVAVSNYTSVNYSYQGKARNYPVMLAAPPSDTNRMKASFVHLNNALKCFEENFFPYQFDRVGYVIVPFNSGAMEHATNISYPSYGIDGALTYETTMAHELSHHWWGDLVTCRTDGDMWLNEGWAVFCEAVFSGYLYGADAYKQSIKNTLYNSLRWAHVKDEGFRALSPMSSSFTYGYHSYRKGACVVNSLKNYMGDSAFFKACNAYLSKYALKDASSNDLRDEFQKFTSRDLTKFFNNWVFDKGSADVAISSFHVSKTGVVTTVNLQLAQRLRVTTNLYYEIPVEITFYDSIRNKKTFTASIHGLKLDTSFNFTNDYYPVFATVNENIKMSLACTYDQDLIKTTGNKNYTNGMMNVIVQEIPDSAFLDIEHHWTQGDADALKIKGLRLATSRYWRIEGIIPNTFKATGYFPYDGSTPASKNGGFLDNDWLTYEDSLVLLYRSGPDTAWMIHTDNSQQTQGNSTDKTGRFIVNKLQKGEYAFALRDVKSGIEPIKKDSKGLKIYPNPSKNILNIEFEIAHKSGELFMYDQQGKIIFKKHLDAGEDMLLIDTSGFSKGLYIVGFDDGANKSDGFRFNKKIILE